LIRIIIIVPSAINVVLSGKIISFSIKEFHFFWGEFFKKNIEISFPIKDSQRGDSIEIFHSLRCNILERWDVFLVYFWGRCEAKNQISE